MSAKTDFAVERREMESRPPASHLKLSTQAGYLGDSEEQEGLLTEATEALAVTANHR